MKIIGNELIVEARETAYLLESMQRKLESGPMTEAAVMLRDIATLQSRQCLREMEVVNCLRSVLDLLQKLKVNMRQEIEAGCSRKSCHQRVRTQQCQS